MDGVVDTPLESVLRVNPNARGERPVTVVLRPYASQSVIVRGCLQELVHELLDAWQRVDESGGRLLTPLSSDLGPRRLRARIGGGASTLAAVVGLFDNAQLAVLGIFS